MENGREGCLGDGALNSLLLGFKGGGVVLGDAQEDEAALQLALAQSQAQVGGRAPRCRSCGGGRRALGADGQVGEGTLLCQLQGQALQHHHVEVPAHLRPRQLICWNGTPC